MSTEGNFLKWERTELTTWISHQQTHPSGDGGECEITAALCGDLASFSPSSSFSKQPSSFPRLTPNYAPERHLAPHRCPPGLRALRWPNGAQSRPPVLFPAGPLTKSTYRHHPRIGPDTPSIRVRSLTLKVQGDSWKTLMLSLLHSTKCMDRGFLPSSTATRGNMLQSGVVNTSTRYAHLPPWGGTLELTPSADMIVPSPVHPLPHQYLQKAMKNNPILSIPDILNQTFHDVDSHLSKLAEDADGKMHSGCTAVTAFLRLEDPDGKQSFLENCNFDVTIPASPERTTTPSPISPVSTKPGLNVGGAVEDSGTESPSDDKEKKSRRRSRIKNALKSLSHSSVASNPSFTSNVVAPPNTFTPTDPNLRRVLYCANAGDARGVLCRGGKAIRLTYDHKGSDKQEAKRIMDAGGFVMSGRVNGVLAVTRSLGDSSMKEFVVGSPYTTETELYDEDEFVILACDGVSSTLASNMQSRCG